MNSLFISTYSELIIIGLLKDGKLISKKEELSNRSHSIYTIPMIDSILKENNMECTDLNEIIVINGPGSFTGVRLGVTIAKTLAYTLSISIKTITSIDALAVSSEDKNKIIVISDSKGKYFGVYEKNILKGEIEYLKDDDFELIADKYDGYEVLSDIIFDIEAIYEYSKNLKETVSHAVKPIYVKGIEALNGR